MLHLNWTLKWKKHIYICCLKNLARSLFGGSRDMLGDIAYITRSCHPRGIHPLQWRHNGRDSVSNHQPYHYLLNRLFRCRSKKTTKLRVTCPCAGTSPGTGEFPAQMASNADFVPFDDVIMHLFRLWPTSKKMNHSIWWRHHAIISFMAHIEKNESFTIAGHAVWFNYSEHKHNGMIFIGCQIPVYIILWPWLVT